jgi:hypothetical protein
MVLGCPCSVAQDIRCLLPGLLPDLRLPHLGHPRWCVCECALGVGPTELADSSDSCVLRAGTFNFHKFLKI